MSTFLKSININKIISALNPVYLFAIFFLAPFIWISGEEIFFGPDSLWDLNASRSFYNALWLWKSTAGFGYGWADQNSLIHSGLVLLIQNLGFSFTVTQQIVIGLLIFFSALFFYRLLLLLFGDNILEGKIPAIFGAIAYVVNPFALTWVWWRFLWVVYVYPAWPLVFILLIKILRNKVSARSITLYCILLTLFTPGIGAILMMVILSLSLFTYIVSYLLLSIFNLRDFYWTQVKYFVLSAFLIISLNVWWFLPGILMLNSSISNALTAYNPVAALEYTSSNSQIYNVFLLWGYRAIHIRYNGETYYGEWLQSVYESNTFHLILLVPFFFFLFLLFSKPFQNSPNFKHIAPFYVIYLIGVFLVKGLNTPFAFLNRELLNLPFGTAFRIPYDKFGYWVAFSSTLLFSCSVFVYKQKYPRIVYLFSLIYVIPLCFFFLSPNFLPHDKGDLKGVIAVVPPSYKELSNIVFKNNDKILVLPPTPSQEVSYNWDVGVQSNSDDIISAYVDIPVLFLPNGNQYSDKVRSYVNNELFDPSNNYNDISSFLRWVGLSTVLLHSDWNRGFMETKSSPPEYYKDTLFNLPGASVISENSYFSIFRVAQPKNYLRTGENIYYVDGDPVSEYIKLYPILGQDIVLLNSNSGSHGMISSPDFETNFIQYPNGEYGFNFSRNNVGFANLYIRKKYFEEIGLESITLNGKQLNFDSISSTDYALAEGSFLPGTSTIRFIASDTPSFLFNKTLNNYPLWLTNDWECYPKNSMDTAVIGLPGSEKLRLQSHGATTTCSMYSFGILTDNSNGVLDFEYDADENSAGRVVILEDNINAHTSRIILSQVLQSNVNGSQTRLVFKTGKDCRYRMFVYNDSKVFASAVSYYDFKFSILPGGFDKSILVVDHDKSELPPNSKIIAEEKINPVLFKSKIEMLGTSTLVVLDAAYDENWNIDFDKNTYDLQAKHVLVNGYLNGWILSSLKRGEVNITIQYYPQRWFYVGLIISGVTLFGCVSYLGYDFVRRRRKSVY